MEYTAIAVEESKPVAVFTLCRGIRKNPITKKLLLELNDALDAMERDESVKIILLQGESGYFCTGMDLEELSEEEIRETDDGIQPFSQLYMDTLKRMTCMKKIVISKIDGKVMAGGVGLAAASDFVFASKRTEFCLSEALWENTFNTNTVYSKEQNC